MEERAVARITEWDRREVGDGLVGLSTLADGEFSGAVDAGGAWLFMLNGRIVGESGGSVDSLGTHESLTAYTAPHPSLPLLFAMWARGGNTQGRYFTDDTELAEVHDTLSSGSFTGYIELSENVHSGDYYVVYYGGRALFAAFVGAAERLVTGEDAFERANDEVGIYEVNSVDLAVRDAPEPPEDATGTAAGAGATAPDTDPDAGGVGTDAGTAAGAAETDDAGDETATAGAAGATGSSARSGPGAGRTDAEGSDPEGYDVTDSVDGLRDPDPDAARTRGDDPDPRGDDAGHGDGSADSGAEADPADSGHRSADADPGGADPGGAAPAEPGDPSPAEPGETDPAEPTDSAADHPGGRSGDAGPADRGGADATDAPDPEPADSAGRPRSADAGSTEATPGTRTGAPERRDAGGRNGSITAGRSEDPDDGGVAWDDGRTVPALDPERTAVPTGGADAEPEPAPASGAAASGDAGDGDAAPERVAELEAEIEALRERVESLSEERDRLAEERDRATGERDRLATERDDLETRLEDLLAEQETAETDLDPSEALSRTDLFVRHDSKSQPTLADAHDGDASPETVGANLRLETHTRFDGDATVDGEAFESFLRDTLAYRFVAWLTGEFLFEIRDTGNEAPLRDLYDALPQIDRVEFDGTVTVRDADGEEVSTAFDVVLRNRMGEPILVADVDEGRDPTRGAMIEELLERSTTVVEAGGSIAGVFLITASFFDNEVHEAVLDATKTGFLDRDSRTSFVKTSRNDGYHVCLVEARSDRFHLSRPDL